MLKPLDFEEQDWLQHIIQKFPSLQCTVYQDGLTSYVLGETTTTVAFPPAKRTSEAALEGDLAATVEVARESIFVSYMTICEGKARISLSRASKPNEHELQQKEEVLFNEGRLKKP